jgi:DNA-binding XRE family transcriptional regulator
VLLYLYASLPTVMLRPKEGPPVNRPPKTPASTPPVHLGTEIRRIRQEQGVSQRRLARLAGVDRASLRRFEEGQSRGNLQLVEAVADALGYELELMFRGFAGGFPLHPPK